MVLMVVGVLIKVLVVGIVMGLIMDGEYYLILSDI